MNRKNTYLLLLCAMTIVYTSCYRSITPMARKDAKALHEDIQQLSDGTLVVRLYTNNPKRRVLLDNNRINEANKHTAQRKEYIETMMNVWNEYYDYCQLRFIPDSLYLAWSQGDNIPVFINSNGELDQSLKVETNHYAVLGRGGRDYAFVWLDSDLKPWRQQPPINYDRMSIWELFMGTDEVLNRRVQTINDYFHNVNQ